MDVTTLTSLIGSFGFPIVACLGMAWFVKDQIDKNRAEIKTITEEHKKEMGEVTTALNNNTVAITKLCERLGKIDETV